MTSYSQWIRKLLSQEIPLQEMKFGSIVTFSYVGVDLKNLKNIDKMPLFFISRVTKEQLEGINLLRIHSKNLVKQILENSIASETISENVKIYARMKTSSVLRNANVAYLNKYISGRIIPITKENIKELLTIL